MATTDRFTTADLERLDLPEGWRAEIIDGVLYTSKAPGWDHQDVVRRVATLLAFARILEATAQDDAIDVLDLLVETCSTASRTRASASACAPCAIWTPPRCVCVKPV
jgi:hypothetical protein